MSMVFLHRAYSSLENCHLGTSNTLLLAWYFSARILLRQRTPRAFSPFIARQCWWPKELLVCSACQWPWSLCKRPAIRNPRFSSLSLALGQWVSRNWREKMSYTQRSRRVTWILHYWSFQSEHYVTEVLEETVRRGIVHQQFPQLSTTQDFRQENELCIKNEEY